MQKKPELVGHEAMTRRAFTPQVKLMILYPELHSAPGTVTLLIQGFRSDAFDVGNNLADICSH